MHATASSVGSCGAGMPPATHSLPPTHHTCPLPPVRSPPGPQVITADVPAGKAVVHVIDKVLLPMAIANATDVPADMPADMPTDAPAELPTGPVSGAAGLMASAAAVAASLVAAAFLA